MVTRSELCAFRAHQPAETIVQRFEWKTGIESRQRGSQARLQHDLTVVCALAPRFSRCDLKAVLHGPSKAFEPLEGSLLDDGFGDAAFGHACSSALWTSSFAVSSAAKSGWYSVR